MKGFAMLEIGKTGWIEKERPKCGPLDAIIKDRVKKSENEESKEQ